MATVFKASYATLTLLGQLNQFHGIASLQYDPQVETTINYKHGILPELPPPSNVIPKMEYFGIGIKGYHNLTDGTLSEPYYPLATNMDLYQPIPFRCVPIEEDLTPIERVNYRMRTVVDINGETYVQYWLKKLDFLNRHVQVNKITPDGQESSYVWDGSNRTPTPNETMVPDVDDGSNTIITVSLEAACSVTGEEVIEVINALYGGDLRLAKISEFGLYTGVDKSDATFVDAGGANVTYTESIYTQLAAHRCTNGVTMDDVTSLHTENLIIKSGNITIV